jgi:hypothetical protein
MDEQARTASRGETSRTKIVRGSSTHAGRVEHVVQFTVKAELVRPIPEVRRVEIETRVLHDAQRIFKIMRAAGLELKQDPVLRTADVQGDAEELK